MDMAVEDGTQGVAQDDLYSVLHRIGRMYGTPAAREAAEALRAACQEGRLYGMSYGYCNGAGEPYVACALGHIAHAVDPVRYKEEGDDALDSMIGYPRTGEHIEDYVMYVPKGATPADNHIVANVSNWLDHYLDS